MIKKWPLEFELKERITKKFESFKKKTKKGFTLIEMMIVLLVISILVLLFIPNLSKQKDTVSDQGDKAVVKVVESQIEIYEINHDKKITDNELQKLVTSEQYKIYKKYQN